MEENLNETSFRVECLITREHVTEDSSLKMSKAMYVLQTVQGRIQASWGVVDWVANPPFFGGGEQNSNKNEEACDSYGRNKGKHSGQVPHFNFFLSGIVSFSLEIVFN